jgi:hypothetical protein
MAFGHDLLSLLTVIPERPYREYGSQFGNKTRSPTEPFGDDKLSVDTP